MDITNHEEKSRRRALSEFEAGDGKRASLDTAQDDRTQTTRPQRRQHPRHPQPTSNNETPTASKPEYSLADLKHGRVIARMNNPKNIQPLRERVWTIYKDACDKLVLDNIEPSELPTEERKQWIALFQAFETLKHFSFMKSDHEIPGVIQHRRTIVHSQRYVMESRYLGILKGVAMRFPEAAAALSKTFKKPLSLDSVKYDMAGIARRFKEEKRMSESERDNVRRTGDTLYLACRSAGFESEGDIIEILTKIEYMVDHGAVIPSNIAETIIKDEEGLRDTLYTDFFILPRIFGPKEASLCHVWACMLCCLMTSFFEPPQQLDGKHEFLTWTSSDALKGLQRAIKSLPTPADPRAPAMIALHVKIPKEDKSCRIEAQRLSENMEVIRDMLEGKKDPLSMYKLLKN